MTNVEKYIELRNKFIELVVEHYKSINVIENSNANISDIKQNMIDDIDSVIEEVGIEEAIYYVEDLIENQEEFFQMSREIHSGTFDFKTLIEDSIESAMGINIGDILFREDEVITVLCKVIGFTELNSPIVEYLNVEYHIDVTEKENLLLLYKKGDIMPYLFNDFHNDKFI